MYRAGCATEYRDHQVSWGSGLSLHRATHPIHRAVPGQLGLLVASPGPLDT